MHAAATADGIKAVAEALGAPGGQQARAWVVMRLAGHILPVWSRSIDLPAIQSSTHASTHASISGDGTASGREVRGRALRDGQAFQPGDVSN